MTDKSDITQALNIGAISSSDGRTVDITTTGAKTGQPQRIEIWFHQIQGRWYITGTPPKPRGWYRNLELEPHFTFHLKYDVKADLSATARPVTDPAQRRQVLNEILTNLTDPTNPAPLHNQPPLDDWVAVSPLIEITFDDLN